MARDAPALAAALSRLIADPALAAHVAKGGRKTFEESFTAAAYVRETLRFYHAVLART